MNEGTEVALDEQQQVEENILATEELELPPATPDAHIADITGVELVTFDSGTQGIRVKFLAQAGFEESYTFFPPAEFMENPLVDPKTLSEVPPEGKKQSARDRYAATIASSAKDAEVQRLFAVGGEAGRVFNADLGQTAIGKSKAENIGEFVAVLNVGLVGAQAVIARRPDLKAEDPRYRNRLRVTRILPISSATNPKQLKGYRKAWEDGQ